ncbi:MAG: hypothetical protein ACTHL8_17570 [Burkholderiaceae bacterium]
MTQHDQRTCPGCQRTADEAQRPTPACADPRNAEPGRCLMRLRAQQAAQPVAASGTAPAAQAPAARQEPAFAGGPAAGPARDAGGDGSREIERQLAEEREAKRALRERLRTTEALAAESAALRERMSDEIDRMKGELDRLRAGAPATAEAAAAAATGAAATPPRGRTTSSLREAGERAPAIDRDEDLDIRDAGGPPFHPPSRSRPRAGWLAFGLVVGLAAGAAGLAWLQESTPGGLMALVEESAAPHANGAPSAATPALAMDSSPEAALAAAPTAAGRAPASGSEPTVAQAESSRARPLPPVDASAPPPLAQSTTSATSASTAPTVSPQAQELAGRVRGALVAEGVTVPVTVDPVTHRVDVADPDADRATRDRTDTVIRAVFAGASLPEPQIEHRWVSERPARVPAQAAAAAAPPVNDAVVRAREATATRDRGDAARRPAVASGRERPGREPVADPVSGSVSVPWSPIGRLTVSCQDGTLDVPAARRGAALAACMNRSCCDPSRRHSEECQGFARNQPLRCVGG